MTITIDKLIRSRRRTIAIEISHDAELIVRVPNRVAFRHVEKFVNEKKDWILSKQELLRTKKSQVKNKKFETGDTFLFLGEKYFLSVIENVTKKLELGDQFILSSKYQEKAKDLFEKWYKKKALEIFLDRAGNIARENDLSFTKIKINSAKHRWGSCTSEGNINLCWRLIMAPIEVVDYVIAHELAHLVHRNHSRRFWAKVLKMHPTYKKDRKWLKDKGHILVL